MEKNLNGTKSGKLNVNVVDFGKIESFPELLRAIANIVEIETEAIKQEEAEENKPITVESAIERIAEKLDIEYKEANKLLATISKINPAAAFNIVSKELAILLDQKYEGTINNSDRIFGISNLDGKVVELDKRRIKSYKNFAAFRTFEDAKTVCILLKEKLKDMFKVDKCNKTTEK